MNILQAFKTSLGTRILGIFLILLLAAAIPLTVWYGQKQQEIRQRAQVVPVQTSLYFAPDNDSATPITQTLTLSTGQEVGLRLYMNSAVSGQNIQVDGFDITIEFGNGLTLNSVTGGPGADQFNTPLFGPPDTINNQNKTFRFAKFNTGSNPVSGTLHLATLRFTASSNPLSNRITYTRNEITSLGNVLTVQKPDLNYTISAVVSPSPTSPPVSTTPTSIPPTPTPTPSIPVGRSLTLSIPLQAVGGGTGKNNTPRQTSAPRNAELFIYDESNSLVHRNYRIVAPITLQSNGNFQGTFDIGSAVVSGVYTMIIKVDKHLPELIPGVIRIPRTQPIQTPELVVGDLDGDGELRVEDYNIFMSCFGRRITSTTCLSRENADINEDGVVDEVDGNYLIRNLARQRRAVIIR